MNKRDAREIAETITNKQLSDMVEAAKKGINDWTKRSSVNKSFDLGVSWNILCKNYTGQDLHVLAKKNMIWEFGDFLPDSLKLAKKQKRPLPEIQHQEPVFDNIIMINPGNVVMCDFCNDDFTDSDEMGGFLFQSKAVCPHCEEKVMADVKKYGEEQFIKGKCPELMSFADWVRSIR